jgi:hypothetical protein
MGVLRALAGWKKRPFCAITLQGEKSCRFEVSPCERAFSQHW